MEVKKDYKVGSFLMQKYDRWKWERIIKLRDFLCKNIVF